MHGASRLLVLAYLLALSAWSRGEVPFLTPYSLSTENSVAKARENAAAQRARDNEQRAEEAEQSQLKAKAMTELNDLAASGDLFAMQNLLHHVVEGEQARRGLTAAAASGSRLATFVMAVWDYKASKRSPENPAMREQALATLKMLNDYFPARYWLLSEQKSSQDEFERSLKQLMSSTKAKGMWVDYLHTMQSCREAQGKSCLTQLEALRDQGFPWGDYPSALVRLYGASEVRDMSKGRALLEAANAQDKYALGAEQKVMLAWLTFKGIGGAADPDQAQKLFAGRGSTYVPKKSVFAPLQNDGCGELKTKAKWSFSGLGAYPGGFGIRSYTVFEELPSKEAKTRAAASCERMAEAGDANAMAWMGAAYDRCIPECSDEKRNQWFIKAAQAGNQYAAYALVAYASKATLVAAQQAVEKYSPQWDADTRLAASYNLAMANNGASSAELDGIMRQLKQRPDLWQTEWALAMLRAMVEEKKIKELEPGDALRAYATQIELIDAKGQLNPGWNYDDARSKWFNSRPWSWNSGLATLDDENYYALAVTECSAWTTGQSSGSDCRRIPSTARARPPAMALKPDGVQITVGDFVLHPSGTVQQPASKLEWMPCSWGTSWNSQRRNCQGNASSHRFSEIPAVISKANTTMGGQFGHADWRLPTLAELNGLMQCRYGKARKAERLSNGMVLPKCKDDPLGRSWIPQELFPNITGVYWTSTVAGKNGHQRFSESDRGWVTDWGNEGSNYVLLVRNLP